MLKVRLRLFHVSMIYCAFLCFSSPFFVLTDDQFTHYFVSYLASSVIFFQLYLCGIDGTGAMDLLRKSLQHSHEGGHFSLVQAVRMGDQKGFQTADLSE